MDSLRRQMPRLYSVFLRPDNEAETDGVLTHVQHLMSESARYLRGLSSEEQSPPPLTQPGPRTGPRAWTAPFDPLRAELRTTRSRQTRWAWKGTRS